MQLAKGSRRVGEVLQHLHRQRPVEAGLGHRQRGRVPLDQPKVVLALGAAPGQRQGLGAGVDPDHRAGCPDLGPQLGHIEAWPTADVKDPLTGGGLKRLRDQPPPPQHITRAVQDLELGREVVVKDQLAHRQALPLGRIGRWQLAHAHHPTQARNHTNPTHIGATADPTPTNNTGRPIGPWSWRTGAPEASATRRDQQPSPGPGPRPTWVQRLCVERLRGRGVIARRPCQAGLHS